MWMVSDLRAVRSELQPSVRDPYNKYGDEPRLQFAKKCAESGILLDESMLVDNLNLNW
jgi:hypothetical protein